MHSPASHRLPALAGLILAAAATPAAAQSEFRSDLDARQTTPPNSSLAGGWGVWTLNADNTVSYHVETHGLDPNGTNVAHIHEGDPGVGGGAIVFALAGGPEIWDGRTPPLSAFDLPLFQRGGMYMNVHTQVLQTGEIRGQILPLPATFGARVDGLQNIPPSGSTATGHGSFTVHADRTVSYDLTVTGLSATAAHLHSGISGVGGPVIVPLVGGPTQWSGTSAPLSEAEFAELQVEGVYVNVHTTAFPGGEIRGQLLAEGLPYGQACKSSAGEARLSTLGPAVAGYPLTVQVDNGLPGGGGWIAASTARAAVLQNGCPRMLAIPLVRLRPVMLDASGAWSATFLLPGNAPHVDLYLQFAGTEAGVLYASRGLELLIRRYP
ncbi:MAG TPA: CHRD domain-containing protein [Planctomycetota bacterium]